MALRKMTPGGYEYLTGSVACADHDLDPGESMADYYFSHGYPPGQWIGAGAAELGMTGEVTEAHMLALFGEGRHPRADEIMTTYLAAGQSPEAALHATRLGRRFPQYGGEDALRRRVGAAYKQHNRDNNRPAGVPLEADTRQRIREQVYRQAFAEAHNGRTPDDATELGEWLADQKRTLRNATAGYELVFAPDKATSAAWAIADSATSEVIADAHRQAVRDAVSMFESEVAFTRAGHYGQAQMDVHGVTAAVFEHWDSRTGDPHLHTHVPVSTKVKRSDGQWTSLDGRTVHAAAVTVSEFYNNRLRDLLREQGATFVQRPTDGIDLKRPVWELETVPTDLVRAWSQRSQHIEQDRARRIVAFRREHGREPEPKELLELGRRAQYGTRSAKAPPQTLSEHRARWQAFADSVIGTKAREVLSARLFTGSVQTDAYDLTALAHQTRQQVSDHLATFNRWNLTAEAHRQTAGLHLTPDQRTQLITDIVETVVAESDTVTLRSPAVIAEPAALQRHSGESVFGDHNADRFTTKQTLREESELVGFARRRDGHRLTPDMVAAAVHTSAARGRALNTAQTRMVAEFSRSGRRVQLALAPAGTGKTTAMRVFAEAWRSAGGRVYAFGPSARAAQELGESIGARPHTLHQIPAALKHGNADRAFPFRPGDVLIVDEAAMAGTHTLHTVVDYALRRGADVRLIGDDRQLTAVEAGGAIRLLAHDVGAIRFREVVRFRDPAQAEASLQIRDGDKTGIDYYHQRGWVAGGSIETMRDSARRGWRTDLEAGRETLLIVGRNDDVIALNLEAHAHRVDLGEVDTRHTTQLHDGTVAGSGDWIVTRDNARHLPLFGGKDFVKNGDTWSVQHVADDGSLCVRHRDHSGTAILPTNYVQRDVELAYATTINRTQGMTVRDSTHTVVPPETTREQLYPGITRSAGENRMYVVTSHHVADSHRETPPEQTAERVLAGVMRHSGAELSATEALRQSLGEEESLSTLVLRHDFAADRVTEPRYRDLVERLLPDAIETAEAPALWQALRNAEDTGWQAERLLPTLIRQNSLSDNDDPTAELVGRIERHVRHHQPPARIAEPGQAELERWRELVTTALPEADVTDTSWNVVWQHAAGGVQQGFDADTAVSHAASQLADRHDDDAHTERELARVVVTELAEQRRSGHGDQPALPWLAQHHHAGVATTPDDELATYLRAMNTAIAERTEELRQQVAHDLPDWTVRLGERPEQATDTVTWDRAVALTAAYRETYGVTTNDPDHPLGPRPEGHDAQARGWDTVTEQWTTAVALEPDTSSIQQHLESLRDQLHAPSTQHPDGGEHPAQYEDQAADHETTEHTLEQEDTDLDHDAGQHSGSGLGY